MEVQKAYWLGRGDYFELGNIGCHIYLELARPGLVHERLEAAWQQLIERHDMLRAVAGPDGLQRVLPRTPPYRMQHHRLSPSSMPAELEAIRRSMSHQLFPADRFRRPLLDYAWPHLRDGDVARNAGMLLGLHGWWSILPLLLLCGVLAAVWRRAARAQAPQADA